MSPVMFYTASYAAMNVGAFAVVSHFANAGEKYVTLEDYAGLGRRSPVLAATLTFFLMSLIGIPITGGFFAKFYVLNSALKSGLVGLAIILRAEQRAGRVLLPAHHRYDVHARAARRRPGRGPLHRDGHCRGVARATLVLGVFPGRVLDYTTQAADQIVHGDASTTSTAQGQTLGRLAAIQQ